MKVGLAGGQQASAADIAALEKVIGASLDAQYRAFVEAHDGAEPESNSFPVGGIAHMGEVRKFIPIREVASERRNLPDIGPRAFPVARDSSGNYMFLDQDHGGAVFFWDHEIRGGISHLADGFDAFLEMLEPFDESTIESGGGVVVYTNPELAKKYGLDST